AGSSLEGASKRSTRVRCTCRSQHGGDGRPARSTSSARLRATTAGSSPSAARALPRLKLSNGGRELPAPQRSVVKAWTFDGAFQLASSTKAAALKPLSRVRERGWGEGA